MAPAVRCFALLVALLQLNAEEIPLWTLNLEYDGDDLEPQAAYDVCKVGTRVWIVMAEQPFFHCRTMSAFICSEVCLLSK